MKTMKILFSLLFVLIFASCDSEYWDIKDIEDEIYKEDFIGTYFGDMIINQGIEEVNVEIGAGNKDHLLQFSFNGYTFNTEMVNSNIFFLAGSIYEYKDHLYQVTRGAGKLDLENYKLDAKIILRSVSGNEEEIRMRFSLLRN